MNKSRFSKHIIYCEIFGFCFLIITTWANEFLDLPHHLFGGPPTPFNIAETVFESTLIFIVGLLVVWLTLKLLLDIRHLEGILPICASCKRIRDSHGYWFQMEAFIRDHSDADFTHGICPDCTKKLYPTLTDIHIPDSD